MTSPYLTYGTYILQAHTYTCIHISHTHAYISHTHTHTNTHTHTHTHTHIHTHFSYSVYLSIYMCVDVCVWVHRSSLGLTLLHAVMCTADAEIAKWIIHAYPRFVLYIHTRIPDT